VTSVLCSVLSRVPRCSSPGSSLWSFFSSTWRSARLYVVCVSWNQRINQACWRGVGNIRNKRYRVTLGDSAASSPTFCIARSSLLRPLYATDRLVFSALLSIFVSSFYRQENTRTHVDHCKNVFCELFITSAFAFVCLIEKDVQKSPPMIRSYTRN
jgi:hypothetical protein